MEPILQRKGLTDVFRLCVGRKKDMTLVHAVSFLRFTQATKPYLNGLTVTTQHSLSIFVLVSNLFKHRIGHNRNLHRQPPNKTQTSISP